VFSIQEKTDDLYVTIVAKAPIISSPSLSHRRRCYRRRIRWCNINLSLPRLMIVLPFPSYFVGIPPPISAAPLFRWVIIIILGLPLTFLSQ
jgi:hypothetical protein